MPLVKETKGRGKRGRGEGKEDSGNRKLIICSLILWKDNRREER